MRTAFPSPVSPDARPLCLASASPRRRDLLASIGVDVQVKPCDIDESRLPGEAGAAYVRRLAGQKAEQAARLRLQAGGSPLPVLGADTAIVLDGDVLGKPNNLEHAEQMLLRLSGRTHQVVTGVCVLSPDRGDCVEVTTDVSFAPLDLLTVQAYCATQEPLGKAGSYAIQGFAAVFIAHLVGSYSNVVGLPLRETAELLAAHKVPVWQPPQAIEPSLLSPIRNPR